MVSPQFHIPQPTGMFPYPQISLQHQTARDSGGLIEWNSLQSAQLQYCVHCPGHHHHHHLHHHHLQILDSLVHITDPAILPLYSQVHRQGDRRLFVTHLKKISSFECELLGGTLKVFQKPLSIKFQTTTSLFNILERMNAQVINSGSCQKHLRTWSRGVLQMSG